MTQWPLEDGVVGENRPAVPVVERAIPARLTAQVMPPVVDAAARPASLMAGATELMGADTVLRSTKVVCTQAVCTRAVLPPRVTIRPIIPGELCPCHPESRRPAARNQFQCPCPISPISKDTQGYFIVGCVVWSVVITRSVMTTLPNLEAFTTLTQAHTSNCPDSSLNTDSFDLAQFFQVVITSHRSLEELP